MRLADYHCVLGQSYSSKRHIADLTDSGFLHHPEHQYKVLIINLFRMMFQNYMGLSSVQVAKEKTCPVFNIFFKVVTSNMKFKIFVQLFTWW